MKLFFTEKQHLDGLSQMLIEDILFTADCIEGEGKIYRMSGSAVIEGETYRDFCVEFETVSVPEDTGDAESILAVEWDIYDFIFEL